MYKIFRYIFRSSNQVSYLSNIRYLVAVGRWGYRMVIYAVLLLFIFSPFNSPTRSSSVEMNRFCSRPFGGSEFCETKNPPIRFLPNKELLYLLPTLLALEESFRFREAKMFFFYLWKEKPLIGRVITFD